MQLDIGELHARALRDAPVGQSPGFVSRESDIIAVVIDPNDFIAESDESNNHSQGLGVDWDDLTYFPWDNDRNGVISPTDAIFVNNRIGLSPAACLLSSNPNCDALADSDGNGFVTPTDALRVINRLGYAIHPESTARPKRLAAQDVDALLAQVGRPRLSRALARR